MLLYVAENQCVVIVSLPRFVEQIRLCSTNVNNQEYFLAVNASVLNLFCIFVAELPFHIIQR